MKNQIKIFCSLLFTFLSTIVYGQEYIPLLQKGNQWNTIEIGVHIGPTSDANTFNQWIYRLAEETEIDSKNYFRLIISKDSLQTWQDAGFLREDLESKQVYYLHNNQENLLYDFSLQIGNVISNYEATIDRIDSIQIDNTFHQQICFKYKYMLDSWIEGVGQDRGGLIPLYKEDTENKSYMYFIALVQNEELVYVNKGMLSWFVDIWGVKNPPDRQPEGPEPEDPDSNEQISVLSDQENVRIYSDKGMIILETDAKQMVHIYTIDGKRIISESINGKRSFNLNPGIYVIKVGQETYKIRVI